MSDTFGRHFRISDSGDTHGEALQGMIEGCPAGVVIDMELLERDLQRRAPSSHRYSTQRREADRVYFLTGISGGVTTGEPVTYAVPNCDVQPDEANRYALKPSHASYTYKIKYGIMDNNGCGRASARQTVCRVIAGVVAKCFLKRYGITIEATSVEPPELPDGDTAGALVNCTVRNLPAGLGEPVYDKFSARLACAMLSINCAKGFEIGKGFAAAQMLGSQYNDIQREDFSFISNNDGGVQAGITNGQELWFSVAFKPIPSLRCPQPTITFTGQPAQYCADSRNDRCVLPRVLPVVEAMTAVVIADFILRTP
ncbi:MAG: chorismate synthase [Bacteroidales bacterium]|jgi:chorismate synthase|nr:chorismate synthase [Bacteroidales bacterium]